MSDLKQKQESGDSSLNIQAQSISVTTGLTYAEVKEIATDIFRANFLELKSEARILVEQRADELISNFLSKLEKEHPEAITAAADPDMQYVIYESQKAYARSGNKDLGDLLVDILVKRAASEGHDLQKIVLNEALQVAQKLTTRQLDSITIKFLIGHTKNFKVNSVPAFKEYLKQYLSPFSAGLTKEQSDYQHIEYVGCGSVSLGSLDIYQAFRGNYPGVLCKGFRDDAIVELGLKPEVAQKLFTACLRDSSLKQVIAIDDSGIEHLGREAGLDEQMIQRLKNLQNGNLMTKDELKKELVETDAALEKLWDAWENSSLHSLQLTSVGIALAHANIKRKTRINFQLGIWIK